MSHFHYFSYILLILCLPIHWRTSFLCALLGCKNAVLGYLSGVLKTSLFVGGATLLGLLLAFLLSRRIGRPIESLNARYRRAVRARGHFPNDAAALKCLYLVTRSLDPTGRGRARWATRWKPALNAFAIAFEGRIN